MALFNLDKEWLFINQLSEELVKNVIDNTFNLYKVSVSETKTNIYGESLETMYLPAVQVYGIFTRSPQENVEGEHGINVTQKITFALQREDLKAKSVYPEVGDILEYNNSFFEINNVEENVLIEGQPEKNFSVICTTHLTRRSRLDIDERQR
jgi:signal peptidase I